MKDKPVSHKNLNTFHFQTFAERIKEVRASIVQLDVTERYEISEKSCYFWEAFEKWRERDYSLDYEEFRKDVGDEIETFNQILFRKNEITQTLLKYLDKGESLAFPAILELTVALAKDLKSELYPKFPEFFSAIVSNSSSQDVDLLEKLFQCLAGLFAVFWKDMVTDICSVYELFSPLLNEEEEHCKRMKKKVNNNREHLRRLACEGFAFLIRKVSRKAPDRDKFFEFVFCKLKENSEKSIGVSRLLFETVRNAQNQFQSCLKVVLESLLNLFRNENLDEYLVESTLLQMLHFMADHAFPISKSKKSEVVRDQLVVDLFLCNFIKDLVEQKELDSTLLNHILRLVLFWINFKTERSIKIEPHLVDVLVCVCKLENLGFNCMESIAELMSSILLSGYLRETPSKTKDIISRMYSGSEKVAFFFTENMFNYGIFAGTVLPVLLTFCLEKLSEKNCLCKREILKVLSKTVLVLRPSIESAEDVKTYQSSKVKIYFHLALTKLQTSKEKIDKIKVLEDFILTTLIETEIADDNMHEIWSALVCFPHLSDEQADRSCSAIESLSHRIHGDLLSIVPSSASHAEKRGFLLCQAYFSTLLIKREKRIMCYNDEFFFGLLKRFPSCVSILRLVDCYISNTSVTNEYSELISIMIHNLASPFHLVRKFSLKIIKGLLHNNKEADKFSSVINICLEAEDIPCDVASYRTKLLNLRKLEHEFLPQNDCFETDLKKVAINYLLSMLYVNFKLLWEPTMNILETLAHGSTTLFWEVFFPHLKETIELCKKYYAGDCDSLLKILDEEEEENVYSDALKSFCMPSESPDVINHRLMLWKTMELFPHIVETKNRVIVPLLFEFMMAEVVKVDTLMASTEAVDRHPSNDFSFENSLIDSEALEVSQSQKKCKRKKQTRSPKAKKNKTEPLAPNKDLGDNISSIEDAEKSDSEESDSDSVNESEDESISEDEIDDEDIDMDSSQISHVKRKSSIKKRFQVTRTLSAYLSVFAKFRNPKGGYKVEELESLYKELLCYHDPLIQKLAFDCIMTFNYKFISPYKENFYRILNNKTFKTEVVLFNLDTETNVIQAEHRMDALSILMRILYGKMLHKTGNNTAGKSAAHARRSLVLRFLAGCTAEELKMFFGLVFMPFKDILKDETIVAVKKIRTDLDFSSIIPIRKQHSALNTLGLMLQHFGNLAPQLLPELLKVLLVITATSSTLLEKREEVLPQCIGLLKSVRTLAVMKLIQFFKSFEDYPFTSEEMDAVFESIIWPMLPRLKLDSVNQPSPLLRLFATWSENIRFFTLFGKYREDCSTSSPLEEIMNLYSSVRSKARVVAVISTILFQLLTAEDKALEGDEPKQLSYIAVANCVSFPDTMENGVSNFGLKLVLRFVDKVLSRFEMTITALAKKRMKKSLPPRDLTILLKISRFVKDWEQSKKLIQLLPSFLTKPKIDSESEVLILSTISNLLKSPEVKDPQQFIPLLAPFFGKLTNQNSRISLVETFSAMAESQTEDHISLTSMQEFVNIITKMNAYDENAVEEPDYQTRLDGNREALVFLKSMDEKSMNVQFIRIIIFNSSYVIRMCDDIALRTCSSNTLQELSKILSARTASNPDLLKVVLFDSLLPEMQKGIRISAENIRQEFLLVLSEVLRSWREQPNLRDLVSLCHEDKEMDFWENIRHLQVHRRARALLRFANVLKTQKESGEDVSIHCLTSYMIPIVQSFLFDVAYKKHVHVVDAAIETLGQIAFVLPWHHYEPLLKQYLKMLCTDVDNQKTLIKIIVSLLNAFHFQESVQVPPNVSESIANDTNVVTMENVAEKITPETANNFPSKNSEKGQICFAIRRNILPLLHRTLMKKSRNDDVHKLSKNYYPEDDEILRVPIALAMVKLLQNLPTEMLEKNLPGLFLRMCDLLKTKTESVRETARDTLVKMMESLGSKYFPRLLSEMRGVMKRGYQFHVMTFTINAVLIKLNPDIKPNDLDDSVKDLVEVCTEELFSDIAEEKEVDKITGKLKEARIKSSFSILTVLSRHVSNRCILDIIEPFKEVLSKRHRDKVLKDVVRCLHGFALGLSENKYLTSDKLLIFIHSIVSQKMPDLIQKKRVGLLKPGKYERPDCYLIPKEPGRSGPAAIINSRTTDHILVEFALELFYLSLNKNKVEKEQKKFEMLDPFVSHLADCLSSNQIKTIIESLRCLVPLYRYPLPSFTVLTKKMVGSLFILVNRYAGAGMGQGENFQMIHMCFKLLTHLVRDTSYHKFSEEQLQSLLKYIEVDINDYTRQATAFSLLKAILSRKLQAPDLERIMKKIAEMSITSMKEDVKAQCRRMSLQYMLDYPHGKKVMSLVKFYIEQLSYKQSDGCISAMEMINMILSNFPKNILQKNSTMLFLPLSTMLVNADSSECKNMSAQCIKKLLDKVEHNGRVELLSLLKGWLHSKKMSYKRLGVQVCGLFVEVEGENFEQHLHEILPLFPNLISDTFTEEEKSQTDERCTDHFLFHILTCIRKVFTFCPVIRKEEFSAELNSVWDKLQDLILHPHSWVRSAIGKLYHLFFSTYSTEEISNAVSHRESTVYINSKKKLRDLSADFCSQLQSVYLSEEFGEQIVRNLLHIAKIVSALKEKQSSVDDDDDSTTDVTLEWMIRRLCREAKREVTNQPTYIERRKCVFTFMAALVHELGKEKILPLLNMILAPICREVSDGSKVASEDLKKHAQEALDIIKNIVGVVEFSERYSKVQMFLLKKRANRKKEKAQEAVTNPEKYALKRIKKQQSKKESKKRKILKQKGKKKVKKAKFSDLVIAS